ncbi:hypothetical protein PybrP1_001299 [[Pythium] brassicae (nom. inval.)]|nr:hypothetical protein PybrP1_001299 [[Pythium] brassicae (nom. inval.)]
MYECATASYRLCLDERDLLLDFHRQHLGFRLYA